MGGKKSIDVQAPAFTEDALLGQDRQALSDAFQGLTSGEFLDPESDLGFLAPLTQRDPDVTRLALEEAQGQLDPLFTQQRQDLQNQIIALGGGTSSTLGDALTRQAQAQESQFQGITAGAALQDRERALSNIGNLFGTGLQAGGTSVQAGLSAQGQRFDAEQQSFENQLALQQLNQSNRGGFAGGLTGALGGGLSGFATGGPIGAGIGALAGGLGGGFGPAGTGGQLLGAGATLSGGGFGGRGAGRLAADNPFSGGIGGGRTSGLELLDLFGRS